MYECYTGSADDKTVRYRSRDLNKAVVWAWAMRGDNLKGPHAGIMKDDRVVFSTDLDDPEYVKYLDTVKEHAR